MAAAAAAAAAVAAAAAGSKEKEEITSENKEDPKQECMKRLKTLDQTNNSHGNKQNKKKQ